MIYQNMIMHSQLFVLTDIIAIEVVEGIDNLLKRGSFT